MSDLIDIRAVATSDLNMVLSHQNTVDTISNSKVVDESEDGISLLFAQKNPHFRWVQAWGKWYEWNGKVWLRDEKLSVYTSIRQLVRVISSNVKNDERLRRSSTIASIEKLSRSDERLSATVDQWDRDISLINTFAGIVNLESGKVLKHDLSRYMTRIANAELSNNCPRWLEFLNEVTNGDKDLASYLQRVIGYSLTGSIREHELFFLYGTGRNGKGVFLNTLVDLLGDYAGVAPMQLLIESKSERHPTELAGLMGKRLVVAQEVDEGGGWAEAKIKALTGGDPLPARFMRQDFFTFNPQFKLLIAGNHKPALKNIDKAITSRFNLIPFTVTIPEDKIDPNLQEKLKAEYSGILQWAIDGAVEYHRSGLNVPEIVRKTTKEYFNDQDTFQQWIGDCCEVAEDNWETPTLAFNSWKDYAKQIGDPAGNSKSFKQRMEKCGFHSGRTGIRGRHFEGIKVNRAENEVNY